MDSDVQEVLITDDIASDAAKPDTAPPPANDSLESLEKALENTCTTLASLGENIIDFSYDSQDVIFTKINELVKDFQEVDQTSQGVQAIIPFDVIEAIDKGRNPEQVTYQLLESCAEANNVARGKLRAMRAFRDELEKSAKEAENEGDKEEKKEEPETEGEGDSSVKRTNGFGEMDAS